VKRPEDSLSDALEDRKGGRRDISGRSEAIERVGPEKLT